jgi:superfamily II DNA or RNA helicase
MNRDEIQREAIDIGLEKKFGTIVLPPGLGKTKVAVEIAKHYNKVLVIVPTTVLKEQWKDEFIKWGNTNELRIECFAAAHKISEGSSYEEFDLVIIDESHLSLGPVYKKIYDIRTTSRIALTGTPPKESVDEIIYSKNLDEAVEANAVEKALIYNLEVNFDPKNKASYTAFDKQFKAATIQLAKYNKIVRENSIFDLARKYSVESSDIVGLNKAAKAYWGAMTLRKWSCYNNREKIKVVKNIITKIPKNKWIIFTKSISFAKELAEELDAMLYHSNMKTKDRENVIDKFKSATKAILVSVDALNAGLNVPDTDAAICASGTSIDLTFLQQLGRISRKTDKPKVGLFINLFTKNTVEETWVKNKTKTANARFIKNVLAIHN